jgi:hypothetical protein
MQENEEDPELKVHGQGTRQSIEKTVFEEDYRQNPVENESVYEPFETYESHLYEDRENGPYQHLRENERYRSAVL